LLNQKLLKAASGDDVLKWVFNAQLVFVWL